MSNGDCAISSMQVDMRIYTAAEAKTPYFKRDYSLCDFVVQAQRDAGLDFFESGVFYCLTGRSVSFSARVILYRAFRSTQQQLNKVYFFAKESYNYSYFCNKDIILL